MSQSNSDMASKSSVSLPFSITSILRRITNNECKNNENEHNMSSGCVNSCDGDLKSDSESTEADSKIEKEESDKELSESGENESCDQNEDDENIDIDDDTDDCEEMDQELESINHETFKSNEFQENSGKFLKSDSINSKQVFFLLCHILKRVKLSSLRTKENF
jgi:hypothetical protein